MATKRHKVTSASMNPAVKTKKQRSKRTQKGSIRVKIEPETLPGFDRCLMLQPELCCEFLAFLDPHNIASLCEAIKGNQAMRTLLRDSKRWRQLIQLHCKIDLCGVAQEGKDPHVDLPMIMRTIDVPYACHEMANYLSLRSQLHSFNSQVHVVQDDLGVIERVDSLVIDCLAFPTSAIYLNPHRGVAGRVHQRAGPDLNAMLRNLPMRLHLQITAGSVLVTPGFSTGVRLLVHCVGPAYTAPKSDMLLYTTYVNALLAIEKASEVTCAAFASISTGLFGYPMDQAAQIALWAVRDVIRSRFRWDKHIVFVGFDKLALKAFQTAMQETLKTFHMTPFPYPDVLGPINAVGSSSSAK